uniref:Uncharacterized protein n=1 Tax=uncultured Prochlorococcus marinus clone HOT0M-10G7 TaxID=379385 RepID=Q1PJJ6_PROMR|nr:conserved hypothetical protein [uncultured Prochlorococcus marinus clone HOT0M-10G7]
MIISSSEQKTYPCSLSTFFTIISNSEKGQPKVETTNVLGIEKKELIALYFRSNFKTELVPLPITTKVVPFPSSK